MTHASIQLTEDEFASTYPLVPNHLDTNASWTYGDGPGCLFETYGEELAFVRRQHPRTIWTLVERDDNKELVLSGYHHVNRLGYLISAVQFPEDTRIEVPIPFDSEIDSDDFDSDE